MTFLKHASLSDSRGIRLRHWCRETVEIQARCWETFKSQHHYVIKVRKKVTLQFTTDPFRADEITPAARLLKSQVAPEAPYAIKVPGNFWKALRSGH